MKNSRKGFTLLELSIVLTIIGLIIGGVLTGQSLIRAARLQSILTDVNKFNIAESAFEQKYQALPGDMPNATAYWGAAGGNAGDNYTTSCYPSQGTGTQTCNGNGNGITGNFWNEPYEYFRFWQQLANAGLIEGSYSGTSSSGAANIPGTNCPTSRVGTSVGYSVFYLPSGYTDINAFPANYKHMYLFGTAAAGGQTINPALTAAEAYSLDSKIDDGQPASGIIMSWKANTAPLCTTSDTPAISQYKIAQAGNVCPLIFLTGY